MGRDKQIHSPGLFIKAYLLAKPDHTAYPEEVHHAYKKSLWEIPVEVAERILRERPDLGNLEEPTRQDRLVRRTMVIRRTTLAGEEVREVREVFWLRTKYRPGRPQLPYRVARYAAFAAVWHILVRRGALEFVREEIAPGAIDPRQRHRFAGGRWAQVPVATRPKRHFYQLTPFGEQLDDRAWCNPRAYENLIIAEEADRREAREPPLTPRERLRLAETLPECYRQPSVAEMPRVVVREVPPPEEVRELPPPPEVPPVPVPALPELPRRVEARGQLDEAITDYLSALATRLRTRVAEGVVSWRVVEIASGALSDLLDYLDEVEVPEEVRQAKADWTRAVDGLSTALRIGLVPGLLARIDALIGE